VVENAKNSADKIEREAQRSSGGLRDAVDKTIVELNAIADEASSTILTAVTHSERRIMEARDSAIRRINEAVQQIRSTP